jgi:CHAT domain-containing protein/Tfp pilus assembly protein PilF
MCEIRADQLGIDLFIRVLAPGSQPYEVDRWSNPGSFEKTEVFSHWDAELRFDIASRNKDAPPGKYRLSIVGCRGANSEDQKKIALILNAYRYFMVGQQYRESDEPAECRKALEGYRNALTFFKQAGDVLGEVTTVTYIGDTLTNMGENQAALAYFEQALPLWRHVKDADGLAETLHNMGTIYYEQGKLAKALTFYYEALPLWGAAGDMRGEAATESNIGRVFDSSGEYQKALLSYRRALPLATMSGDKSWQAQIQHNSGMVFLALGDPDEAIQEYNAALDLSRQDQDKWAEGHMLHHLGEALLAKREFDQAERTLNEALKISTEAGDDLGRATTLLHIGQSQHFRGDHQQALVTFQKGLRIRSEKKYRLGESQALYLVGREFLCLGRIDEAKASLGRALSLAHDVKEPRSEAQAMTGLAQVYRRQHRLGEALRWFDRAIGLVEELRTHVRQHELRALFVSTVYDYYEAARDVSMELDERSPEKGHGERAFVYAERARARSLLDAVAGGESPDAPGEPLQSQYREESEQTERVQALSEQRLLLMSRNAAQDALRSIDRQVAEASTRLKAARAEFGQPGSVGTGRSRGTVSIEVVRSRMTTGKKVFLEFSLGAMRSYLWVITRAGMSVFVLPARNTIEDLTRSYLDRIRPRSQKIQQDTRSESRQGLEHYVSTSEVAGAELSKALLGPAWSLVRNESQLVIVPDGILHYVPFAALPLPTCIENSAANGPCNPLLLTHEISYVPSGSVGALLSSATLSIGLPRPRSILMFVDPIYGMKDGRLQVSLSQNQLCGFGKAATAENQRTNSGAMSERVKLGRLLYSHMEADAVAAMIPADRLVVKSGAEASLDSFLSSMPGDFQIIHLATHALADPVLFQGSGIVLSLYDACGNPVAGFLPAERLAATHMKAHLVVLSACETALGREVLGEGLMGLVYAFLRAGSKSVVASLWKVDDASTAELMKHFYVGLLQQHLAPGAALRYSQLKIYREYPAWRAPGFWAGFVFEGNETAKPGAR